MLNNINKPQGVPSPNVSVLERVIELCSAFGVEGEKSELKKMLDRMLDVQKSNEELLVQAKIEYATLDKRTKQYTDEIGEFAAYRKVEAEKIDERVKTYNRNLSLFQIREEEINMWEKSKEEAFGTTAKNQADKEKELSGREKDLEAKMEGHKRFEEGLTVREVRLGEGVSNLNSTISHLKNFLQEL